MQVFWPLIWSWKQFKPKCRSKFHQISNLFPDGYFAINLDIFFMLSTNRNLIVEEMEERNNFQ